MLRISITEIRKVTLIKNKMEEHERQDIVFHVRCINIDRVDLNITDGCYPLTRCRWTS